MVCESIQTFPLDDVLEKIVGGGTPSKKVKEYFDGNIPWATVKDLNGQYIEDTIDHITEEAIKNSSANLIEKGQIIIATRMALGKAFINKKDMAINQDLKALYPKKFIDKAFLLYSLLSKSKQIEAMGSGTTVKGIRLENLKTLPIEVPPYKEQQKIAAILSSVDKAIEKTEQIIEQTEKVKKGLMQQLLTKGIEHREFKDTPFGKIPLNWNIIKLKDISEKITKGTTPTTYGFKYVDEGVNFIKVESIDDNGNFKPGLFSKITNEAHKKLNRSNIIEGDLLISIAGNLGRVAIASKDILPANTNQAIAIVRINNGNINLNFLYYLLKGFAIEKYIKKVSTVGAQPNLSLKQVGEIELSLPNKEEQDRITEILNNIDMSLQSDIDRRNKLLLVKQGLMQQLLTGKVRVKVDSPEEVVS